MTHARPSAPAATLASLSKVLASVLFIALPISSAAGDTLVENRAHRFVLTLGSGWTQTVTPEDSLTPLLGYAHDKRDALLAVSRVDYPNIEAWRDATRDAYYEDIEEGLRRDLRAYRRLSQHSARIENIPTLDLVFSHRTDQGTQVVLMRFLFYRTYSLSLTVSAPERSYKRDKRALTRVHKSFKPRLD